ncbi:MAG: glycoside hydrolase family 97 N-terminal domain-containing protein, partial [Bacteroidales bacterium]|nr:glycoside hydrolase family 97 N-terminal domain-containing protein [Bacteroidales bacterium]
MKNNLLTILALTASLAVNAQTVSTVKSPDGRLAVNLRCENSRITYSASYDGKTVLESSPLGLVTDVADFTQGLGVDGFKTDTLKFSYNCRTLKRSSVDVKATHAVWNVSRNGVPAFDLVMMVKDNDIAFRYEMRRQPAKAKGDSTFCAIVKDDQTHFNMPQGTTTFLSAQMKGGTGWSRTAPSYETPYFADRPTGDNADGAGFIFPCLFKTPNGWVLISETGVTSAYCGSHLDCTGGNNYKIANPMDSDFNYNGSSAPGIPLPGCTPWRTITIGTDLAPI